MGGGDLPPCYRAIGGYFQYFLVLDVNGQNPKAHPSTFLTSTVPEQELRSSCLISKDYLAL